MDAAPPPEPRRARAEEANEIADLWLEARRHAVPSIPPAVHADEAVRSWFATVVLPVQEAWVIGAPGAIAAMLVLDGHWIEQLYVLPPHQHRGLGSCLVEFAKAEHDHLQLWTFQSNAGARRFYERHGFTPERMTAGDNEENAPDVCYRWARAG